MELDYIEEWKEKELQSMIQQGEEYKNQIKYLENEIDKATKKLQQAKNEYQEKTGISPSLVRTNDRIGKGYEDPELNKLYKQREIADDNYWEYKRKNSFYSNYVWSKDFEDRCKKEIDKHFKKLQTKVENKIGQIIKIKHLGGDDYYFQGEKGNCKVEVILAGGYNIQRLHTRWIIKNMQAII